MTKQTNRPSEVLTDARVQEALQVLFDQHGPDAELFVAEMVDVALEAGDVDNYVMWSLIEKAMERVKSEFDGRLLQ